MRPTLTSLLAAARERARALRPRRAELERAARQAPVPPDWNAALAGPDVAIIAEVKRRSPSAGVIALHLDPADWARRYVAGGARAVSVLTDERHFGGSLDDLRAVRDAVPVPVLRKDFVLDPLQLLETRAAGASAVLLIVRALEPAALAELSAVARELKLARLIEVHHAGELEVAVPLAPEAIGVNARDLDTFAVSLDGVAPLLAAVPTGMTAVAESGIALRGDVERVAAWGADAILVGTALAGASNPAAAVRRLAGVARTGPRCGAPDRRDATS
jgi:indole-3-glycerol phosphate synthase